MDARFTMDASANTLAWVSSANVPAAAAAVPTAAGAADHRSASDPGGLDQDRLFQGWLPLSQAAISVQDPGVRQSVTAVERLRTYGGRIVRLHQHLVRLRRTLDFLAIDTVIQPQEIAERLQQLLERNRRWCLDQGDVGITLLATPGRAVDEPDGRRWLPTEIMHLNPLPLQQIERHRQQGQAMVITNVQQPPAEAWPRDIKVRCRLHYYLADHQADQFSPGSAGVLLDADGTVTETSVANLAIVTDGEIISPPPGQVLPGVTQDLVQTLAEQLQINWRHQRLYPADLRQADEILLMGTDGGLWFVSQIDGQDVGASNGSSQRADDGGGPPVYRRLLQRFDQWMVEGAATTGVVHDRGPAGEAALKVSFR